jgi:hypothetical protein
LGSPPLVSLWHADLQELSGIRGIGDKTIAKVREVINSGKIQRREQLESSDYFHIMTLFKNVDSFSFSLFSLLFSSCVPAADFLILVQVFGVGPTTAHKWYAKGYRSPQEVLSKEVRRFFILLVILFIVLLPLFFSVADASHCAARNWPEVLHRFAAANSATRGEGHLRCR